MAHFFGWAQDNQGNRLAGASVTVFLENSLTLAPIFSASTMAPASQVAGSVLTSAEGDGFFEFYAPAGVYKYTLAKTGYGTVTVDDVLLPARPGVRNVRESGATGDGTTDDTAAVANEVAAALAAGEDLYWPAGTYLTTASIPDLHSVRHRGPGVIKRGSDLFKVEPKVGQTNTVYLSASGADANDGLSSSQPTGTATTAHNRISAIRDNYGPMLGGKWVFRLLAGSYTTFALRLTGVTSDQYQNLEISGPDVSWDVPTAILTCAGTTGFFLDRGAVALIKDVWIKDGVRGAICIDAGHMWCSNVHVSDMTTNGIVFDGPGVKGTYRGGIIDNTVVGVAWVSGAEGAVDDNGVHSAPNVPVIKNCTGTDSAGVRFREASSGHCDFAVIDNCDVGLDIDDRANCHFSSNTFQNNTVGWQSRRLSTAQGSGNTYSGNTTDIGLQGAPAGLMTGSASPAAGATSWASNSSAAANENQTWFRAPFKGVVRNLYVRARAAPGTGESLVVMLRKNGADTALTATVSGTSVDAENTAASVEFAAGDRLTFRLVASNNGSYAGTTFNIAAQLAELPY